MSDEDMVNTFLIKQSYLKNPVEAIQLAIQSM